MTDSIIVKQLSDKYSEMIIEILGILRFMHVTIVIAMFAKVNIESDKS